MGQFLLLVLTHAFIQFARSLRHVWSLICDCLRYYVRCTQLCLNRCALTYFIKGSIAVRLVSSLTGLDSTKEEYMLLFVGGKVTVKLDTSHMYLQRYFYLFLLKNFKNLFSFHFRELFISNLGTFFWYFPESVIPTWLALFFNIKEVSKQNRRKNFRRRW